MFLIFFEKIKINEIEQFRHFFLSPHFFAQFEAKIEDRLLVLFALNSHLFA
jgi:hypothetical protein